MTTVTSIMVFYRAFNVHDKFLSALEREQSFLIAKQPSSTRYAMHGTTAAAATS
jgi:hypothetical protein